MGNFIEASTEFYNLSYGELIQLKGEEKAASIVEHYQRLSRQYRNHVDWPIHRCKLLTTHKETDASPDSSQCLMDKLCSVYYSPVKNKTDSKDLSIRQVAGLIKSDRFLTITQELRGITDTKANREFKQKRFCYATFSGTFSYCSDVNLTQHSGLICIDVDHLGESLPETQAIINGDPATVMSFVSPNGDGLKVLYEMQPGTYSQSEYYQVYSNYICGIAGLKPGKIDQSCKNVSRACFLPCDPEIFVNPYFAAQ